MSYLTAFWLTFRKTGVKQTRILPRGGIYRRVVISTRLRYAREFPPPLIQGQNNSWGFLLHGLWSDAGVELALATARNQTH